MDCDYEAPNNKFKPWPLEIIKLQSRLSTAIQALLEIAEHPHKTGDKCAEQDRGCADYFANTSVLCGRREGHRCCAAIASDALGKMGEGK